MTNVYGLRFVASSYLTEIVRVEHDRSRFIEYEPTDESWRRYFGFVTDEVRPSGTVYRTGNVVYAHPAIIEELRRAM